MVVVDCFQFVPKPLAYPGSGTSKRKPGPRPLKLQRYVVRGLVVQVDTRLCRDALDTTGACHEFRDFQDERF